MCPGCHQMSHALHPPVPASPQTPREHPKHVVVTQARPWSQQESAKPPQCSRALGSLNPASGMAWEGPGGQRRGQSVSPGHRAQPCPGSAQLGRVWRQVRMGPGPRLCWRPGRQSRFGWQPGSGGGGDRAERGQAELGSASGERVCGAHQPEPPKRDPQKGSTPQHRGTNSPAEAGPFPRLLPAALVAPSMADPFLCTQTDSLG